MQYSYAIALVPEDIVANDLEFVKVSENGNLVTYTPKYNSIQYWYDEYVYDRSEGLFKATKEMNLAGAIG